MVGYILNVYFFFSIDIPEEEPQGPTDPDDILQYLDEVKKENGNIEYQVNETSGELTPKKVSFQVCQPSKTKRQEYIRRYVRGYANILQESYHERDELMNASKVHVYMQKLLLSFRIL